MTALGTFEIHNSQLVRITHTDKERQTHTLTPRPPGPEATTPFCACNVGLLALSTTAAAAGRLRGEDWRAEEAVGMAEGGGGLPAAGSLSPAAGPIVAHTAPLVAGPTPPPPPPADWPSRLAHDDELDEGGDGRTAQRRVLGTRGARCSRDAAEMQLR